MKQVDAGWQCFSRWLGSAYFIRCQATKVAKHRQFFHSLTVDAAPCMPWFELCHAVPAPFWSAPVRQ